MKNQALKKKNFIKDGWETGCNSGNDTDSSKMT